MGIILYIKCKFGCFIENGFIKFDISIYLVLELFILFYVSHILYNLYDNEKVFFIYLSLISLNFWINVSLWISICKLALIYNNYYLNLKNQFDY